MDIIADLGDNTWSLKMHSKVSLNIIKHWQALCADIMFADIAPLLIQNGIISIDNYEDIKSEPEKTQTETLLLVLLKKNESVLLKFAEALERDYNWLAEKMREGTVPEQSIDETDATPITRMDTSENFDAEINPEEGRGCRRDSSLSRTHCMSSIVCHKRNKWEKRKTAKSRVKNRLRSNISNSEKISSSTIDIINQQKNEKITDEIIAVLRKSSLLTKSWTTIAHSLGLTDKVNDIRLRVLVYNEDVSMCIVYLIKNWLEMFPKAATLSRLIEMLRSENFNKVADELTEKLYSKPATENEKIE